MRKWVCKKHGKDCKSYVQGIVQELNNGRKPTKQELELVEPLCPECNHGHLHETTNKKVKYACGWCDYKELSDNVRESEKRGVK